MSLNKGMTTMLVNPTNPPGIELYYHAKLGLKIDTSLPLMGSRPIDQLIQSETKCIISRLWEINIRICMS